MPAQLSLNVLGHHTSVEQIDDAVRVPGLVGIVRNHHDGRSRFLPFGVLRHLMPNKVVLPTGRIVEQAEDLD